ncbi:13744_t:CDS:2, partial [Acaulospora colombiana]
DENYPWVISLVWVFEGNVDIELVRSEFRKLIVKFPRFRSIVHGGSFWSRHMWQEVEDFDACDNIETWNLSLGTIEELREYASKRISEKMSFDRPLWRTYVVYGLEGGKRSAMVIKAHHCIADGQGCMHAIMGLTSDGDEQLSDVMKFFKDRMPPPSKPKYSELPLLRCRAFEPYADKIPDFLIIIYAFFLNALLALCSTLGYAWLDMVDQFKIMKMSLTRKSLLYKGDDGSDKRTLSWTREIRITDIAIPRKAYGVSLNDVMVTIITRAIRAYLSEINSVLDEELMMFIPMSMRVSTNWECNNASTGGWSFIPMKELTVEESLKCVHREMNKLKRSLVTKFNYIFLEKFPIPGVYNKKVMTAMEAVGHGVITNVPGPMRSLTVAGQKVIQFAVIPPQNCPGGKWKKHFTIFSRENSVALCFINSAAALE